MKKVSILVVIILIVVLGGILFLNNIKNEEEKSIKNKETFVNDAEKLQCIDYVISNFELNKNSGISVDANTEQIVKESLEQIVSDNVVGMDVLFDMRLIHSTDYFDMDCGITQKDIVKNYLNKSDDDLNTSLLISCASYIDKYVDKDEYNIIDHAIIWYQEGVEKTDLDNCAPEDMDNLYDIMMFLYETDNIDKIDIKPMEKLMHEYMENCCESIVEEEKNPTLDTVGDLKYYHQLVSICNEENKIPYDAEELYSKLEKQEQFIFDIDDFVTLAFMNSDLKGLMNISNNQYYVDNINKWLNSYIDKYID